MNERVASNARVREEEGHLGAGEAARDVDVGGVGAKLDRHLLHLLEVPA